jgi:lysyl endopeptidase
MDLTAKNRALLTQHDCATPQAWARSAALILVVALMGFDALAASMPSRVVETKDRSEKLTPRLLGNPSSEPSLRISLAKLDAREKASIDARTSQKGVLQVGVGRTMTKGQRTIPLESLRWTVSGGIRHTSIAYTSAEAQALRLGILGDSIPKGVSIYVYGETDGSVYGPYTSQQIRAAKLDPTVPYWLPIIDGETLRIELQASHTVTLEGLTFDPPLISHLISSPRGNSLKNLNDVGKSGSCNIDIACEPPSSPTWLSRGNSVAKYYFTTPAGRTGSCTGTLLNSSGAGTPPPYFITANHCISTVAEASSMHFYWFFQRQVCNNPATNPTLPLNESLGATYIYSVLANDQTLVRLNTAPPNGSVLAGWNSAAITTGDTMVALHHPQGDLKKYSDGRNQGFTPYSSNSVNVSASHIRMIWDRGTTEDGSSGSGLFNAAGELVGTLHGGGASCSALTSPDWYGRFDQAYQTFQPWLTPGAGGPPGPQNPPTPSTTELTSGSPISGSVLEGDDAWYRVQTAANTISVTVTLTGLNGDADLYVFKNTQSGTPTCVSEQLNNDNETCNVTFSGAGTVYIAVYGYRAATYTVTARVNSGMTDSGGGGGGSMDTTLLALLGLLSVLQANRSRRNRVVR